ncbi:MAG: cation-transporting P-type ATPase, partial [Gammaproteobacteria bacterium]|nr:cation-transporting P-type ATPase [Gammaproteobacteria bacterium]
MSMLQMNSKHVIDNAWHAIDQSEVLSQLASSQDGLTANEAHERLIQNGPNVLPESKTRGPLIRLLAQCHNVLIYVLL